MGAMDGLKDLAGKAKVAVEDAGEFAKDKGGDALTGIKDMAEKVTGKDLDGDGTIGAGK
ncbi:MAG: hypothetical protein HFJ65_05035 [Eggerthellaceae bacterium]|nr:hypothetical protein [Eggerthellaceae bacterium]